MMGLNKGMITAAALVSAVFVTAFDLGAGTPSDVVAARFPQAGETLTATAMVAAEATAMRKGDRLHRIELCDSQPWPYRAAACLVAPDGKRVEAARTVTVERRTGDNASTLVRMPVAVAQR
jgi:hypothetical protein